MDKTQQLMVFAIDDKLRTITMPNNGSVFGVSGDIEVNQVEFQMPRYCAGFDMTDFTGRVNYVNPNGDSNYYESEISGTDDTVSFIWLMKPDVTRYSGDVKFSVKLYKKQDGKSTYEEIKDDYDEMLDELSGESVWFPNPRDTDAEDEDSI